MENQDQKTVMEDVKKPKLKSYNLVKKPYYSMTTAHVLLLLMGLFSALNAVITLLKLPLKMDDKTLQTMVSLVSTVNFTSVLVFNLFVVGIIYLCFRILSIKMPFAMVYKLFLSSRLPIAILILIDTLFLLVTNQFFGLLIANVLKVIAVLVAQYLMYRYMLLEDLPLSEKQIKITNLLIFIALMAAEFISFK